MYLARWPWQWRHRWPHFQQHQKRCKLPQYLFQLQRRSQMFGLGSWWKPRSCPRQQAQSKRRWCHWTGRTQTQQCRWGRMSPQGVQCHLKEKQEIVIGGQLWVENLVKELQAKQNWHHQFAPVGMWSTFGKSSYLVFWSLCWSMEYEPVLLEVHYQLE